MWRRSRCRFDGPGLAGREACTPRHLVLRVYVVASGGSYAVMPGGLTRITSSLDSLVVSMQHGGGSKDTWVLADGPAPQFSLLRQSSAAARRSAARPSICPAAWPTISSGSAATSSASKQAVRIARAILTRLYQESDPAKVAGLKAGVRVSGGARASRRRSCRSPAIAPPPWNARCSRWSTIRPRQKQPRLDAPSTPPRGVAVARSHFGRRLASPQPFRPTIRHRAGARAAADDARDRPCSTTRS